MTYAPAITGLHGCSCHPFQSWEDLDMYMKQRLTGGQLVQIRHTGEKGYVVGNEGQYYRIDRIPCNVPRDITIEHVSNLIPVSPHYCIYDAPVFGIFKITNDKYDISEGWGFDLVKHKIIGEDEHTYITRLIQEDDGSMLPVGIHRTRLDHWTSGQLELEFC
jgi:hypothetical protein